MCQCWKSVKLKKNYEKRWFFFLNKIKGERKTVHQIYHMLCLKMSSGLVRILDPSGAEGLPSVPFNLVDIVLQSWSNLATEELRNVCIQAVNPRCEETYCTVLSPIQFWCISKFCRKGAITFQFGCCCITNFCFRRRQTRKRTNMERDT